MAQNLIVQTTTIADAYQAAHNNALALDRSVMGRFELTGRDRLDLLQRMSTNNMAALKQGEGAATILTTALARIIDRLIVYERGETAIALCGVGRIATVRGWLQKHIFYQDQIKTRDVSSEWAHIGLFGTQADALADRLAPGVSELPLHHFREVSLTPSAPLIIARSYPIAGGGYTLLTVGAERDALRARLVAEGVTVVQDDLDMQVYQGLRIEAGIPEAGAELTEDYIPLEAGLWDAVSFKKGCYIGQEIIARMESRNKLARTLVHVRLSAVAAVGTSIQAGERTVGTLTSVAALPSGEVYALGYVKTDALSEPWQVVDEQNSVISVQPIAVAQR